MTIFAVKFTTMKKASILCLLMLALCYVFSSCLEDSDTRQWRLDNEAFLKSLKDSTDIFALENLDSIITVEKGGIYEPGPVSGILYKVIKPSTGNIAVLGQSVSIKYTGWLYDDTEFDSGKLTFTLGDGSTIDGMREVMERMPLGARWKVYIPYDLGYGSSDYNYSSPTIPAYSVLIFDIELLKIE